MSATPRTTRYQDAAFWAPGAVVTSTAPDGTPVRVERVGQALLTDPDGRAYQSATDFLNGFPDGQLPTDEPGWVWQSDAAFDVTTPAGTRRVTTLAEASADLGAQDVIYAD